jgi:D-glycero-beta-D-manno-heptose-7-phosphate kinase
MRQVRILVVGDLMLDRYISGVVDRISPEAPVPVVRVREESWAVGGAANVAANVLALGASCEVVGCVGEDDAGGVLRDALASLGGRLEGVIRDPSRPTTLKTRVLARSQQVVRFDLEDDRDVSADVASRLAAAVEQALPAVDVLVLEDYNKGVLVPGLIDAALEGARRRGIPSIVDPKRRNFFAYGGVTVFKPNAKELEEALGDSLRPDDPHWMEEVRTRLACQVLLLTRGERGMTLRGGDGEHLHVPAVARSVYDVSGAGDTVTAVVACALAAGASHSEAAVLANHAAAIEVGKAGVATVSPDEIAAHVASGSAV